MLCDVAQGLTERRFGSRAGAMIRQPGLGRGHDRDRPLLPSGKAHGEVATADLGLDPVELADQGQPGLGDRGWAGAGPLDQPAARMGPAMGEADFRAGPRGGDQACITVRRAVLSLEGPLIRLTLQHPFESVEDRLGVLAAAGRGRR
jgi:hypothetical protein